MQTVGALGAFQLVALFEELKTQGIYIRQEDIVSLALSCCNNLI
jgi:hypothetical protein